ncbi:MAG: nucleoside hydrolase [Lentimicrobiaceae bacterium]|nr:nucleoside hydrolase [Lentimicrobiaceae bacterium]
MKKLLIPLLCTMLLLNISAQAQKKEKVILDTDMVEVFDDGITMMMLAKAPNIDLLGATIVVGNTWVNEGIAYAIRQLEAIGRTDIPVVPGIRQPIYPSRFETIKNERILFGIGDAYVGAAGYPEPKSWQSVYLQKYGTEPKVKPLEMKAVNFIIEQVKKNPNEITIIAIGTCVNLATAVRIAPEIVPLIKRVIYMGGSFFKPGNTTPTAEFNWWLDPEAAKMCLRTPFKEQIIVGLDVCEKMPFRKDKYEEIISITKNPELVNMFNRNFLKTLYIENPDYVHYIWDVIAGAIMIDPTLITEEVTRYVDVNSQFGFSYGQSVAFEHNQPIGTQQARIILTVDSDRLWKMVEDYCRNF